MRILASRAPLQLRKTRECARVAAVCVARGRGILRERADELTVRSRTGFVIELYAQVVWVLVWLMSPMLWVLGRKVPRNVPALRRGCRWWRRCRRVRALHRDSDGQLIAWGWALNRPSAPELCCESASDIFLDGWAIAFVDAARGWASARLRSRCSMQAAGKAAPPRLHARLVIISIGLQAELPFQAGAHGDRVFLASCARSTQTKTNPFRRDKRVRRPHAPRSLAKIAVCPRSRSQTIGGDDHCAVSICPMASTPIQSDLEQAGGRFARFEITLGESIAATARPFARASRTRWQALVRVRKAPRSKSAHAPFSTKPFDVHDLSRPRRKTFGRITSKQQLHRAHARLARPLARARIVVSQS